MCIAAMGLVGRFLTRGHPENQYISLVKRVLRRGETRVGRNGQTKAVFGASMRFPLSGDVLPLLTTKAVSWRICLKELLWFMGGHTDNSMLQVQGVRIWDGNASRAFLDGRGLARNRTGDLGPIYGHQWRHFNAPYVSASHDYGDEGVDQLGGIASALCDPERRRSRRLVMSAWNPCQLDEMALPPCHVLAQFSVDEGGGLSCALYQRSGDVGLGVPFNIASYSMLTHILAHHSGLEAREFIHFIGDAHIYDEHRGGLAKQVGRVPRPFPRIRVGRRHAEIGDYSLADVRVSGYRPHPKIPMPMAA